MVSQYSYYLLYFYVYFNILENGWKSFDLRILDFKVFINFFSMLKKLSSQKLLEDNQEPIFLHFKINFSEAFGETRQVGYFAILPSYSTV